MPVHQRRLKEITFDVGGVNFECQVSSWTLTNNTQEGETQYTYCPDGSFVEDTDPQWVLDLRFYSDWRSDGISDYLWNHAGETVSFVLDHHPDIAGEHVRWTGNVKIRQPSVGGDVRTTEVTQVTLSVVGEPTYERVV